MSGSTIASSRIRVLSPAKINWTLAVMSKRLDGFHEISSLVSTVTLYDELEFREDKGSDDVLECDHPEVPTDARNLVCRAVNLLSERAGRRPNVCCRLVKRIPVGGGLGGGSSNGAATLIALNQFWDLRLPPERLAELAAELGSDVSLFLEGGSAVISGRGEKVRPTRLAWHGWIVLLMPGLSVSTAAVYRVWRPGRSEGGPVEPPRAGTAVEWMNGTFNMLETPAVEVCPALGTIQRQAARIAGRPVRVSGSGSTLFTAFDRPEEAEAFARSAGQELGIRTEVVQPTEQA